MYGRRPKSRRRPRFVGLTFLLLTLYVLYKSLQKLVLAKVPQSSLPGIIIASLSLIIMPVLWYKKRELGRSIGSRAIIANSEETLACAAFLSLPLLLGFLANYLFGFWQADPITGFDNCSISRPRGAGVVAGSR